MVHYASFEVAPSGRSRCRGCGQPIAAGQQRLRVGWETGARYFHAMCAVPENSHNLEEAARLPGAPPLTDDVRAAIARQTEDRRRRAADEPAQPPLPAVERLDSAHRCIQCRREVPANVAAVVDRRGALHPACVPAWLDGQIIPEQWERALRENSGSAEIDEIADDLGWT